MVWGFPDPMLCNSCNKEICRIIALILYALFCRHKRAAPVHVHSTEWPLLDFKSFVVVHLFCLFVCFSPFCSQLLQQRPVRTDFKSVYGPDKCSHPANTSMQPIPQHFCWDGGQETRSPWENTNRSISSTEEQITPPIISTLVFHLLPESYPLFPLLSQMDK